MTSRCILMTVALTALCSIHSHAQNNPDFIQECITLNEFNDDYNYSQSPIRTHFVKNSNNEFVLIDNVLGYRQDVFRLNKDGIPMWRHETPNQAVKDIGIDDAGNAFVLQWDLFYMLNSADGKEAWSKSIGNQNFERMVVTPDGNVHILAAAYTGSAIVHKYNKSGTHQWSREILSVFMKDIAVAPAGEVYVLVESYNEQTFEYDREIVKYNAAGTQQYRVKVPANPDFYDLRLIHSPDNTLYLIGYWDQNMQILKIRTSDGQVLGNKSINEGFAATTFGPGNELYLLTWRSFSLSVHRFASNFTSTNVVNSPTSMDKDLTESILVEADKSISIASNDFHQGKFLRFNESGEEIARKNFVFPIFGAHVNSQGDYLIPSDNPCMLRLSSCSKYPIAFQSTPSNRRVCEGTQVNISVTVTGKSLKYQWYKDGQAIRNSTRITGTNTSTLSIASANKLEDAGEYYCVVANPCDIQNGPTTVLSFYQAPSVTKQPANASPCPSGTATLEATVDATQSLNVRYQWKKGTTLLSDGAKYSGAKTNKLTISNITADDAGDFFCEILSDCHATLTTQKATVAVLAAVAIITQPANIATCNGNTVTLSTVASGGNLTYQWRKGTTNINDDATYAGTKTAQLTLKNVSAAMAGTYSCVVSSTCGSVTSSNASVTIATAPSFTASPANASVCSGGTTTFSVTASAGATGFVWKKGNTIISNNAKYSGATTATLTITNATASEQGSYTCSLPSTCGPDAVSKAAELTVVNAPTITGTSPNQDLCEGGIALMSVQHSAGSFTYQWKKNNTNLIDNGNISGAKTAQLLIAGVAQGDAGNYTCVVQSSCASATSQAIALAVRNKVDIASQPASVQSCDGGTLKLKIQVTTPGVTYRWKKDGVAVSNAANILGATTAELTLRNVTVSNQGTYWCEVTSSCGVMNSSTAAVEVNPGPRLELQSVIPCLPASELDWDVLVTDQNSTFGTYKIFQTGGAPMDNLRGLVPGTYFITKSNGACADTVQWENTCIVTALEEHTISEGGSVYPNPASDLLNVSAWMPYGMFDIVDARGVVVERGMVPDKQEIDVSALPSGIYFLRASTAAGRQRVERITIVKK